MSPQPVLVFLSIFSFMLPMLATGISRASDEKVSEGELPAALIDAISRALNEKAMGFKTNRFDRDPELKRVEFSYKCVTYKVHHVMNRSGVLNQKSEGILGPSADGFTLNVRWSADKGDSRAGAGFIGPKMASDYSMNYTNFYELKGDRGFVEVIFDHGPLTDMTILDSVLAELSLFGKPVYVFENEGWEARFLRLQENLTKAVGDFPSASVWRTDGKDLVCEFRTMEFDIHTCDDNGHVSPESHKETGPTVDGFIIRLVPLEKSYLRKPRPISGLAKGPYWREYFSVVDNNEYVFRLEIRYGDRTDEKLLNAVADALKVEQNKHRKF